MGQRHQLFIIGKINNRYRGFAAIHHQWLYGATALKVCFRLLHIFQAPVNRLALQHELRWAKTLQKADWELEGEKLKDFLPFPFIHTCLTIGASFNPAEEYYHMVHPLPFNLDFDGGDNNDGITIIDITDPEHVRYCFVNFKPSESDYESGDDAYPLMTPLSASQYLWSYNNENDTNYTDAFRNLVQGFESWNVIEVDALESAWPGGDWNMDHASKQVGTVLESFANIPNYQPSTLRASSMAKVLDEAFKIPIEGLGLVVESANQLPDFWSAVKAKVADDPHLLSSSPAACHLMSMAFEKDSTIDLSSFELSEDQLSQILLGNPAKIELLRTLSLSGNQYIRPDLLKKIISTHPGLQTLHLLNTPQLPLDIKLDLVKGSSVTEMLTSELLTLPFIEPKKRDVPLSYISPLVKQVVWINYDGSREDKTPNERLPEGGLDIEVALKDPLISNYQWSLALPLINANRPPQTTLVGLTNFIRFVLKQKYLIGLSRSIEPTTDLGRVLGFSLATAFDFQTDEKWKIGPICDMIYRRPLDDDWPPRKRKPEKIQKGEWTLVIISEPGHEKGTRRWWNILRYAFVSSISTVGKSSNKEESGSNVIVLGFEDFLEYVFTGPDAEETKKTILEGWKKRVEIIDPELPERKLGVCGQAEVESWLRSSDFHPGKKHGSEMDLARQSSSEESLD